MPIDAVHKVLLLIDEETNKTIEEIKAAGLTKDFDDPWGTGFVNGETIVNILYSDLSK